jgi:hypothetical protein
MYTVYNSDSALIQLSEKHKLLCISWQAHLSPNRLWPFISTFMRLTKNLNIEKWLINASDSDRQDLNQDKIEDLIHTLANTKVRKFARVVSKDIYVESKINTLIQQKHQNITFRFFSNEIEALDWLLEKDRENLFGLK